MKKDKWPLVGNPQISEYLKKSIVNRQIGGSYIFSGPDNLGKTTVARFLSQIMLCVKPILADNEVLPCGHCPSCRKFTYKNEASAQLADLSDIHGDYHFIKKEKDKKNISIDQIRDFIRTLGMSSFSSPHKVGIIKHADTLSNEAANALLKTLEEPKRDTIIILIVQDVESLPATIVSRSQVLNFKPVKAELIYEYLVGEYGVSREKARNLSRLSQGRPALAVKFLEDQEFYEFYHSKVEALLEIYATDLNGRLAIIDNILDKSLKGQEAVRLASRVLEIWQGVARDWLLLIYGHNNIVQHIYLEDKIKKNRLSHSVEKMTLLSENLAQGQAYIAANVSPRLVFERIALNI